MYVVKYKVRKMAKSLLKHHCYCCPVLLMHTTKTSVCLQTETINVTTPKNFDIIPEYLLDLAPLRGSVLQAWTHLDDDLLLYIDGCG